jgi:CDP-diacylglycerol--glycerol-3-phosphate 3-phosphatidyltransferase
MGRRVAVVFVVASGGVAAVAQTAYGFSPPSFACTAGVVAYTAAYSYTHADDVGRGDYVSLLRAALLAYVAGFVAVRPNGAERYLALTAFVTASLLDTVDGAVARRYGGPRLGDGLDVEVDAMGILVGSAVGIAHGWLPGVYIAVGLARYVFVAGLRIRKAVGASVSEISRSYVRNLLSALQTAVIALGIAPVVSGSVATTVAYGVMIPFLVWFLRDWLVVCGRYN